MFAFGTSRAPRRPSLTPMIDVVFLLLVFFMLSARFGTQTGLALAPAGAGTSYEGPPRLVTITREAILLNGLPIAEADLSLALRELIEQQDDVIVLRPAGEARLQRLVDVLEQLKAAGFSNLAVIE